MIGDVLARATLAVDENKMLAVDENKVTPGVLGFVVVALLGVATFLLIRSMNRQIKRIDLPDDREQASDQPSDKASDDAKKTPGGVVPAQPGERDLGSGGASGAPGERDPGSGGAPGTPGDRDPGSDEERS